MKRIFRRRTIYSPDLPDDPYLDRWTLFSCRWFQVLLHRFHRSDNAAVHDHPWWFVSLVLWRGYREQIRRARFGHQVIQYVRRWPLSLAFRRAEDRHRVILLPAVKTRELLVPGTTAPAWTLVITGPRRRTWYFYPQNVRVPWRVLTQYGEGLIERQIAAGCREPYFEALDDMLRAEEAKSAAAS